MFDILDFAANKKECENEHALTTNTESAIWTAQNQVDKCSRKDQTRTAVVRQLNEFGGFFDSKSFGISFETTDFESRGKGGLRQGGAGGGSTTAMLPWLKIQ